MFSRYRPWIAVIERFDRWVALSRIVGWLEKPFVQALLRFLDRLPRLGRNIEPHLGPRSLEIPQLPPELKGEAGTPRDRAAAEEACRTEGRLPSFLKLHHEATSAIRRQEWRLRLRRLGRKDLQTIAAGEGLPRSRADVRPTDIDPATLTEMVKRKAGEIGISAVGVTVPDPTVTFDDQTIESDETRVIVCILEQNWKATQKIPSLHAEEAHYECSLRLRELMVELGNFILDLGYTARTDQPRMGMNIAYGVEAGLGQLGLNGQLLTPFAGSRTRTNILMTNAPLLTDSPVDYGVHAICDACQACVQNCPTGAIRSKRDWHRGVYKAKIKTERCLPVVTMNHGCGICQKVCPAQRYGLPPVIEEFKKTGRILGKDTDELEGYWWPIDGRFYGAGERPPMKEQQVLNPPGFFFDPDRKEYDTNDT